MLLFCFFSILNNFCLDKKNLEEALNCDDFKAAFISVHTLKGVALNLSFTKLASVCSELTEYLRNYENLNISRDIAIEKFEIIKENYQKVVDEIIKLEQFWIYEEKKRRLARNFVFE